MINMRRDLDHSESEVYGSIIGLMKALDITSPRHVDGRVLLMEHLSVREIHFLMDRVNEMTPDAKRAFRRYLSYLATWSSSWGGALSQNAPVDHALALASVVVPLLERYKGDSHSISNEDVTGVITEAMNNFDSCAQRYMPNDEISERDLPLIRGELTTNIIIKSLGITPANAYSNEFYAWLGSHEDDLYSVYGQIKSRRSFDPDFVRELVEETSRPLAEGLL